MSSKKVQTAETWCNEVIISRYNFPIFFILLKLILTPKQTLILTLIRLLFQTGARHWKHCETRAEICALNVRCRAQVAYWVHCTYVFCARYTFRARRFSSARGKSSARTTRKNAALKSRTHVQLNYHVVTITGGQRLSGHWPPTFSTNEVVSVLYRPKSTTENIPISGCKMSLQCITAFLF